MNLFFGENSSSQGVVQEEDTTNDGEDTTVILCSDGLSLFSDGQQSNESYPLDAENSSLEQQHEEPFAANRNRVIAVGLPDSEVEDVDNGIPMIQEAPSTSSVCDDAESHTPSDVHQETVSKVAVESLTEREYNGNLSDDDADLMEARPLASPEEDNENPAMSIPGAYAVGLGREVRLVRGESVSTGVFEVMSAGEMRPRAGDDDLTTTSTWEANRSDPVPPSQRRVDDSTVLVEADVVDDEEMVRLREELEGLREQVAPLSDTEMAQVVTVSDDNENDDAAPPIGKARKRKLCLICSGIVLLVVVIAIVAAVVVSLNNNSGSKTSPPTRSWQPIGQVLNGKASSDFFGESVSLSHDGAVMAVGAEQPDAPGYVSVLRFNLGTQQWTPMGQELVGEASGDYFGRSVSLNGDGTILAVGADQYIWEGTQPGYVRVFEYNTAMNRWDQRGNDIDGQSAEERFGSSVALSDTGDVLSIGARATVQDNVSGSVQLFQYNPRTSSYNQMGQTLFGKAAGDLFGASVSLGSSGTIVGIGASRHDSGGDDTGQVSVYEYNSTSLLWYPLGAPINGQGSFNSFGSSVSFDNSGFVMAVGAPAFQSGPQIGSVLIFEYDRASSTWTQRGQTLVTQQSGDNFGASVSLSGNGNVVAVGSSWHDVNGIGGAGQVRIFQFDTNKMEWKQLGEHLNGVASEDSFGRSVSLSANGAVVGVGAKFHRANGEAGSGSVYAFTLNN